MQAEYERALEKLERQRREEQRQKTIRRLAKEKQRKAQQAARGSSAALGASVSGRHTTHEDDQDEVSLIDVQIC